MKNIYNYYLKNIKPIEKKYTIVCTLYNIFKLNFLKKRMNYYNSLLIKYYKTLKNNYNLKELENYLDHN